ncbi:MAG: carbohydrate ABC transporter permease [Limnochordia bacterium]|jgi:sn-glycerol 3-phosphate transport system permease protein|nr:carbohydrate ABC transporter permease [Bacillota bacterium]HBG09292.1 ABC transporter permease [Bacillota bacterium]
MRIKRKQLLNIGIHAILIITLIAVAFPIYFAFTMATHTHQDAYAFPPILKPGNQLIPNLVEAWNRIGMGVVLKNSTIIAVVVSLGKIVFSILAAFAFTHFKFRGSWFLFPLCMVTQMMPLPVRVIPLYQTMANWNWLNTYQALTIPYLASTTGIILFRQFYMTVPEELADAARVDGATPMQYLRKILVPLSWTNIAALLVIEFVYMWNEYLWPNIVTTASDMRVAQMGLRMLYTSERGAAEWNIIMAGLLVIMLPPLIVLILFRKQFAEGIAMQTTK